MNMAWIGGRPGWLEIVIILAVLALLFGAKKIPEIARAIGKSLGEFKKGRAEGGLDDEKKTASSGDEGFPQQPSG